MYDITEGGGEKTCWPKSLLTSGDLRLKKTGMVHKHCTVVSEIVSHRSMR